MKIGERGRKSGREESGLGRPGGDHRCSLSPEVFEGLQLSASGGRIWTRCFQLCSRLSEDAVSADHAVVALSRADPFEVSGHPWSSGWRGKDVDGKESQRASKGGK